MYMNNVELFITLTVLLGLSTGVIVWAILYSNSR